MHPVQYPAATGSNQVCAGRYQGILREPPGDNWNESSRPGTGVEHLQTKGGCKPLWVRLSRLPCTGQDQCALPVATRYLPGDAGMTTRHTVLESGPARHAAGAMRSHPVPPGGCPVSLRVSAEDGPGYTRPGCQTVRTREPPRYYPVAPGGCPVSLRGPYVARGRASVLCQGR